MVVGHIRHVVVLCSVNTTKHYLGELMSGRFIEVVFKTSSTVPSFSYIFLIIKIFNMNKAHGWDQLPKVTIKTCGDSITLPLKLIFKFLINESVFPDDWKKSNVAPIHKKEQKNLIKNY